MTAAPADPLGPLERARLALWIIDHPDECAAPLLSVEERARLRAYGYWRARRLGPWVVLARARLPN